MEGGAVGGRREQGRWQKASRRREVLEGFLPSLSRKMNLHSGNSYPEPKGASWCQRIGRSQLKSLESRVPGSGSWQDALLGRERNKQINLLISMIISGGEPCYKGNK